MKHIILLILLYSTELLFPQEPRIADFYNNKDAAITITFDDASSGQYEYAFPILKQYNLFATFGVVGDWLCSTPTLYSEDGDVFYYRMSKQNILSLWSRGNEIAWHGMTHIPYNSKWDWNQLNEQMQLELKFAKAYFSPAHISTMLYPYSKTQGKITFATKSSGFLFGRTGGDKYNEINNLNYYLLNSFAIYNDESPNIKTFTEIIDGAKGKWCILMYHHVVPDTAKVRKQYQIHNIKNTYIVTPQTFEAQMKIIAQKNYWVATLSDVGKYLQQKENSRVELKIENNNTYITIVCNMDPEIYNKEMTVIYNGKLYNMKPNTKTKIE